MKMIIKYEYSWNVRVQDMSKMRDKPILAWQIPKFSLRIWGLLPLIRPKAPKSKAPLAIGKIVEILFDSNFGAIYAAT